LNKYKNNIKFDIILIKNSVFSTGLIQLFMLQKSFILNIKKTKNNCFLSVSLNDNGKLIVYTTLKRRKILEIKNKLIWGVMRLIKKLKNNKLKINFVILNICNLEANLVQHIFTILKTWHIHIISFSYNLETPHNGCRKRHIARKRNKGTKKNQEQILGL